MPITGFEPGSSGIGSNRAANCATTTAHSKISLAIKVAELFIPTSVQPDWAIFERFWWEIYFQIFGSFLGFWSKHISYEKITVANFGEIWATF